MKLLSNDSQSRHGAMSAWATAALLLLLAVAGMVPASARADTMTFKFDNETESQINVKFFARDRNHHWPGSGKAFALAAGAKEKPWPVECNAGERLCFGAWTPHFRSNSVWGAGQNGMRTCEKCCFVCKDGTVDKSVTLKKFIDRAKQ
ncbi:MAG: hypothetical protein ABL931_10605 [Usitatibacteraceae bacterium]